MISVHIGVHCTHAVFRVHTYVQNPLHMIGSSREFLATAMTHASPPSALLAVCCRLASRGAVGIGFATRLPWGLRSCGGSSCIRSIAWAGVWTLCDECCTKVFEHGQNEQTALEREKRDTCSGELGKLLNETIDGELQLGLLHEGLHLGLTQFLKNISALVYIQCRATM